MAKNFGKAGSASTFADVAKESTAKAQVVVIQNIDSSKLIDNPKNGEDISYTADLEASMKEQGFTDPIEVTNFGMADGMYMILSGHRRRASAVKVGINPLPCIVRNFKNEQDVENYTLWGNAQRDSAKDPFLFTKRYQLHENYLATTGFKGSKREEIAKRLGLSPQQADRYNTFNKIIMEVWDMVRQEVVGMSSVVAMATHSEEEQHNIYEIMQESLADGNTLTRDNVKIIIMGYRSGLTTWAEIKGATEEKAPQIKDSGLPLNGFINDEPTTSGSNGEEAPNRNNEVNREHDYVADEQDAMDADKAEYEKKEKEKKSKDEMTDEEKQLKNSVDLAKALTKVDTILSNFLSFESEEQAKEVLQTMAKVMCAMADGLYDIAQSENVVDTFKEEFKAVKEKVAEY